MCIQHPVPYLLRQKMWLKNFGETAQQKYKIPLQSYLLVEMQYLLEKIVGIPLYIEDKSALVPQNI